MKKSGGGRGRLREGEREGEKGMRNDRREGGRGG